MTLQWSSGRIMKMGWSIMEDLLFVQEDGVVLVYDMFLAFKRTFSMGQVGGKTVKCTFRVGQVGGKTVKCTFSVGQVGGKTVTCTVSAY